MKILKKILAVTTISALVIAVTTGCGSNKSTWNSVQDDGEFTFACSGGYPPFNYTDDDGNLVGFDVEIANALGEKMGVKATGVTTDWDGIIGGLTGKRFDCIIGSMAITDERLEQVSFTDPYYYDGAQFFSIGDLGLSSIDDASGESVGVVTGTTYADYLAENYPDVKVVPFESDIDNFMAASDGRTVGLVTSRFVGLQAPEDYNLVATGNLLYSEDIGIAVRQDDTEFLQQLNDALDEIIADGTYETISDKYFGTNILEK